MNMNSSEALDREIMQMTWDKLNACQARVMRQQQAADRTVSEQAADAQAMFGNGQMSERRYWQYLASLKTGEDEIVQDGCRTAREMLKQHRQRMIEALRVGTGEPHEPLPAHRSAGLEPDPSPPGDGAAPQKQETSKNPAMMAAKADASSRDTFPKRPDAAVFHRLKGHKAT